jgi:hypothetical protein
MDTMAPARHAHLLGLVLFCFLGTAAPAPASAAVAPSPVFADGWIPSGLANKIYHPFERALGDRRRMIQISTVSMCLALFIIWWRRT